MLNKSNQQMTSGSKSQKKISCCILSPLLGSWLLALGHEMHLCGSLFFSSFYLFDPIYSETVCIDKLHLFDEEVSFPNNGCHGKGKLRIFDSS